VTQNVEDLRVRRTRKLLQKALLEATVEKGFAHVTVSDIAERAMVNRATFYRHYKDKYDLLKYYIEELSGLIDMHDQEAPLSTRTDPSLSMPPDGLVVLLRHLQANAEFYRVMLGKQGDPAFCAQSFRPYIEQGFRRLLSGQSPQANVPARPPVELIVSYVLHAGVGSIVWWLEEGQACTPEQVAVWLRQLSLAAVGVTFGQVGMNDDGG
jgi:AcrR family transcriptional regulator